MNEHFLLLNASDCVSNMHIVSMPRIKEWTPVLRSGLGSKITTFPVNPAHRDSYKFMSLYRE